MKTIMTAVAVVGAAWLLAADARAQQKFGFADVPECGRACLITLVDDYLRGLVGHDPQSLPLARDVKFVENTVRTPIGAGLWQSATAEPTTFKIYVPDPQAGQIGFIGLMEEGGLPVQIALRLRIDAGLITEIDHLVARNLSEANLENLQSPRPDLLSRVPVAERVSRAAMLDIAYAYYVALQASDGSAAPFADDCVRHENGRKTTSNALPPFEAERTFAYFESLGCAAQLNSGILDYIESIDARRVEIADAETGLVFGLSQFRHPMNERTIKIIGVPGTETWNIGFDPFDLPAAHIFKIRNGEIHDIEALGIMLPLNSRTGWE